MSESTKEDYLHRCLLLHSELTEIHYKKKQDLAAVERSASKIRSQRRFNYEDLERIINPVHWDGAIFWRWPSRKEIDEDLNAVVFDFWHLPKNEDPLLDRLIALFRFIEPVSVILRFVVPQEYGIFSAPVAKVLEVSRGASLVGSYKNYLANIRELRDKKGFGSAADVDRALWVLQLGVLEGRLPEKERAGLTEAFEADDDLRAIRMRNLSERLFSDFTRVQLAQALQPADRALAAQLAGIEFEKMIRKFSGDKQRDKDLYNLIEDLSKQNRINSRTKGHWHKHRKTRNIAMHENARLDDKAVANLIEELTNPRIPKAP